MLKSTLSAFVVVYPDDILVCSKTPEKHAKHLAEVLDTLSVHELVAQASIAFFIQTELSFLDHAINSNGIAPDPDDISTS